VLTINGHVFDGFKQSDVLFTQLLMLAVSRKSGRREGWRSKASLVGGFAARPSEANLAEGTRALENLRAELVSAEVPGLSDDEVDAIIKVERGTGKVRLGVPPENISFERSLNAIEWKVIACVGRGRAPSAAQDDGLAWLEREFCSRRWPGLWRFEAVSRSTRGMSIASLPLAAYFTKSFRSNRPSRVQTRPCQLSQLLIGYSPTRTISVPPASMLNLSPCSPNR
jgi:hypothetical protein